MLAVIVVWFFLRDWRATFGCSGWRCRCRPSRPLPSCTGWASRAQCGDPAVAVAGGRHPGGRRHRRDRKHHAPPRAKGVAPLDPAARDGEPTIRPGRDRHHLHADLGFLPTAFMAGVPNKFFVQFGWTAALAVFFSLVVARMLTPMMAAYILKRPKKDHSDPKWMPAYLKVTAAGACSTGQDLALTAVFAVASCAPLFCRQDRGAFIPPDDLSQTQVYIELEPGSTYAQTERIAEHARAVLASTRTSKLIYTAVGGMAPPDPFAVGGARGPQATLTINLTPRNERPASANGTSSARCARC